MGSSQAQVDKDIGRNRTLPVHDAELGLAHAGSNNSYDEISKDGLYHRRTLLLRPASDHVNRLLEVCQAILPSPQASTIPIIWCRAHAWLLQHGESASGTASSLEEVAFTATVFSFAVGLLDQKTKAALNVSRLAAGKRSASAGNVLRMAKQQRENRLFSSTAWSWITDPDLVSRTQDDPGSPLAKKPDQLLSAAASVAVDIASLIPTAASASENAVAMTVKLMHGLHIYREERKLDCVSEPRNEMQLIGAAVAQLGSWLGLDAWSHSNGTYYDLEGVSEDTFVFVKSRMHHIPQLQFMNEPLGVFQWFEHAVQSQSMESYPSLADVAAQQASNQQAGAVKVRCEVSVSYTHLTLPTKRIV